MWLRCLVWRFIHSDRADLFWCDWFDFGLLSVTRKCSTFATIFSVKVIPYKVTERLVQLVFCQWSVICTYGDKFLPIKYVTRPPKHPPPHTHTQLTGTQENARTGLDLAEYHYVFHNRCTSIAWLTGCSLGHSERLLLCHHRLWDDTIEIWTNPSLHFFFVLPSTVWRPAVGSCGRRN